MNNLVKADMSELRELNNVTSVNEGPRTDISIHDGVISAQRVAVKRDEAEIMRKIEVLSKVNGPNYYYSWEVNNKESKTGKSLIEGGNIKLAMDLARLYGNNQNDIRVIDNGDSWIFYARFVDLETGYSLTKAFQQRKSQSSLKTKDSGRQLDIAFQIGQSKAQRNVILSALSTFADYALSCSKIALLDRVAKNPRGAKDVIKNDVKELGFDISRIEACIGVTMEKWENNMIAKVWAELQTLKDGVAHVDDVYPPKDKKIEAKPVTLDALEETLGKQSDTSPTSIKSEADKEKEMDAAYERQQVEEKERIHRANMATLKPFSPSSKNKKEPEQMGLVP